MISNGNETWKISYCCWMFCAWWYFRIGRWSNQKRIRRRNWLFILTAVRTAFYRGLPWLKAILAVIKKVINHNKVWKASPSTSNRTSSTQPGLFRKLSERKKGNLKFSLFLKYWHVIIIDTIKSSIPFPYYHNMLKNQKKKSGKLMTAA